MCNIIHCMRLYAYCFHVTKLLSEGTQPNLSYLVQHTYISVFD
jgi:hypothetical protein